MSRTSRSTFGDRGTREIFAPKYPPTSTQKFCKLSYGTQSLADCTNPLGLKDLWISELFRPNTWVQRKDTRDIFWVVESNFYGAELVQCEERSNAPGSLTCSK